MTKAAEIAYKAYCNQTGGEPLPEFERLRPEIQAAWKAAGTAVVVGVGNKLMKEVVLLNQRAVEAIRTHQGHERAADLESRADLVERLVYRIYNEFGSERY